MKTTTTLASIVATSIAAIVAGCSSSSPAGAASAADSGVVEADIDAGAEAGDDSSASGCVYPAGPYGVTVGKTLDPSLSWQGFLPKATAVTTLKVTDLYDCDGTKGLNAIVVDSAGQWCVACQGIAMEIPTWLAVKGDNWLGKGIQILNLIIQNNDYEPATVTTAQQWRDLFSLSSIYVFADPSDTFPTSGLPYELLVDPRTMKVVHDLSTDSNLNNDGSDPAVMQLAVKNGAK